MIAAYYWMMCDAELRVCLSWAPAMASNYYTPPPSPQGQPCPVYKCRNAINKLTRYTHWSILAGRNIMSATDKHEDWRLFVVYLTD